MCSLERGRKVKGRSKSCSNIQILESNLLFLGLCLGVEFVAKLVDEVLDIMSIRFLRITNGETKLMLKVGHNFQCFCKAGVIVRNLLPSNRS